MVSSRTILLLLAGALIMMVALRFQGQSLVTPSAPSGILSLEFSKTAADVEKISNEWSGDKRFAFYLNTVLDYFYLLFYGVFLFFAARFFAARSKQFQKFGNYAAIAGITAAALDAIENALMLFNVTIQPVDFIAKLTSTIATTKFLLAGVAVAYVLIMAIASLFTKSEK
ncbi:MAG: hypothetical protein J5I50_06330 [Chitinophagaceae bacterium]|nr:hypothetical protein [Chitinophagaceae bacterium]